MFVFEELYKQTRARMLEEFEAEEAGTPFRSPRLSPLGRQAFPDIMREVIKNGNDETLLNNLNHPSFWNEMEPYQRKGQAHFRRVNYTNAARTFALTEFNTWYVRRLCRRLLDEGVNLCQVYRAELAQVPRSECLVHEGSSLAFRPSITDTVHTTGLSQETTQHFLYQLVPYVTIPSEEFLMEKTAMDNPNDTIRYKMLKYFYDRNTNATSERGKRGSHIRISDIKKELKVMHGLNQSQVMSQLNYLISSGWVDKETEERTFVTSAGTQQPSSTDWYTITAKGIDRIEGASSDFMRENPYASLNITAVNSAVQLGNGNVVNESFVGLARELDSLRQAISLSEASEEDKLAAIAELETINGQLAKQVPNKNIVKMAWDTIANSKLAPLIHSGSTVINAIEALVNS